MAWDDDDRIGARREIAVSVRYVGEKASNPLDPPI
jgi:hypothetical protein